MVLLQVKGLQKGGFLLLYDLKRMSVALHISEYQYTLLAFDMLLQKGIRKF